jgi:hypothetical protein
VAEEAALGYPCVARVRSVSSVSTFTMKWRLDK